MSRSHLILTLPLIMVLVLARSDGTRPQAEAAPRPQAVERTRPSDQELDAQKDRTRRRTIDRTLRDPAALRPVLRDPARPVPFGIRLEIDGIAASEGVVAVNGLTSAVEVVAYREGNGTTRHVAGRPKPTEITLVIGPGPLADALWAWHAQVRGTTLQRRNLAVVFLGPDGHETARYTATGCWPHAWKGLHSTAPGLVLPTEEVSLICETLSRMSYSAR